MNTVTINIPEGKTPEITKNRDNILITFKEHWKNIKTFLDAYIYVRRYLHTECQDLIEEYDILNNAGLNNTYTSYLVSYRIVVAALTNNEERKLKTGDCWFPVVQFCEIGKEKNCWGDKRIGTIEHDGKKYAIVGGHADHGAYAGLGGFASGNGVSRSWTGVGFRSVSRYEIAEHISKYFGRLLFEVHYGGVNCDWKWVD